MAASSFGESPKLGSQGRKTLAAHQSAKESIRSLTCQVHTVNEIKLGTAKTMTYRGRFWRDLDTCRVDTESPELTESSVAKLSEVLTFQRRTRNGVTEAFALRKAKDWLKVGQSDVVGLMLLNLNVPQTLEYVPAELLVARASSCDVSKAGTVFKLEFEKSAGIDKAWSVRLQFDPGVNHLVRFAEYRCRTSDGKTIVKTYEILEFAEPAAGIHVPSRLRCRATIDDQDWTVQTVELSEVSINQSIDAGVFRVSFPNKVVMTDDIRRTVLV